VSCSWGRNLEEDSERLIIFGVSLLVVALFFTVTTSFYFGHGSPGALMITGIILIVTGLVNERWKRNQNENQ
jgi:uncharacterized membrane protein HdeD (DUF308 family)